MSRTLAALAVFLLALSTTSGAQAPAQAPAPPAPAVQPPPAVQSCPELATALRAVTSNDARLKDWPNLARYRDDNRRVAGTPVDVVFMGDSITDSWQQPRFNFFPGKRYVSRGISGQTTPQMLLRMRADVFDLHPKVVVILAGTNDIAGNTGPSTLEMIEDNLASMAEIARANGIRVVLSSVLPVYDYPWKRGLEPAPRIVALNAWMKAYAARSGAVYLDYHAAMADARGGLPPELARDGVHPTDAGYRVMAPLLDKAVAEALGRR